MNKKLISLLTAATLVLSLTACGNNTETQQSSVSSVSSSESQQEETSATSESSQETEAVKTIEEIPDEYKTEAKEQGELVRIDYPTSAEDKYAYVYTPYGYSEDNSYDILYMMHGSGAGAEALLGSASNPSEMKNVLDHLIEKGEMRPMLVVTPTFYTEKNRSASANGLLKGIREFPNELVDYLMPAVESKYSTYAKTADTEGFKASREHRAFSGFSMGSVTTWFVFEQCLPYFHDFIPISCDSWTIAQQGGLSQTERTAETLANAVTEQGYTSADFFIYAVTGSGDSAEPAMNAQINAMNELEIFSLTETVRESGNLTYRVKENGVHEMSYAKMYLYNALPELYPAK